LILCPTRELAIQVANELKKIAKHKRHIHILPIYGGDSIQHQIKDLKRHVQVVVGTPGRVMDHLERRTLSFENVKTVVLDEADEMLNMGFRDDIEVILRTVPKERQTALFSATMPKPIIELAKKYQRHPVHIKVTKENLTASSIEQMYFEIGGMSKIKLISSLIDVHELKLAIIFCNTKRKVDEVAKSLKSLGYKAEPIHGDLNQSQRNKVLGGFRTGGVHMLVATDVAARGIDVSDIDAVFNYDLPLDPEYYVHRIGRTGRAGKTGKSFSFVTGRNEFRLLKNIEQFAKVRVERRNIPSDKEVKELSVQKLYAKVRQMVTNDDLSAFEEMVERLHADGMTNRQLAAALLKLSLPEEKKIFVEREPRQEHHEHRREHRPEERHDRHRHTHQEKRRDDSQTHPYREEHKKESAHSHPVAKRFVKRKVKKVVGY
ncbi:MAG TPA: DEAD/DEAH box helicase, partial [Acidobacteriota bacterium]|nr:DEAD/DEAH box helicase [Acidobacteriota bacterium]